jgi:hypothetical protein
MVTREASRSRRVAKWMSLKVTPPEAGQRKDTMRLFLSGTVCTNAYRPQSNFSVSFDLAKP